MPPEFFVANHAELRGLKPNGWLHFTVRGDFLGHHSLLHQSLN